MEPFSKLVYLKYLRGAELTPSAFRVLICVFNYSDQHGRNAHPGVERLMRDASVSRRTVTRCLAELRDLGWLKEEERGRSTTGRASCYSLVAPSTAVAAYVRAKGESAGVSEDRGMGQARQGGGQEQHRTRHGLPPSGVNDGPPSEHSSDVPASNPSASGDQSESMCSFANPDEHYPSWGSDLSPNDIPLPPEPHDERFL